MIVFIGKKEVKITFDTWRSCKIHVKIVQELSTYEYMQFINLNDEFMFICAIVVICGAPHA